MLILIRWLDIINADLSVAQQIPDAEICVACIIYIQRRIFYFLLCNFVL